MVTKGQRAEIARRNGAKSKGPKTQAGRRRMAESKRKHGLYAVDATVLDVESQEAFNLIRDAAIAQWQPRNAFESQYVEEIADCSWRIARLRNCATHQGNTAIRQFRQSSGTPTNNMDAVATTEIDGSSPQGAQSLLQRRINSLILNRSMVTAELRALRGVPVLGTTQQTLQTEDLPVGTTQLETQRNPLEPRKNPN